MINILIIFLSITIVILLVLIFFHQLSNFFEKIFFRFNVARKVYKIAKDNDYYLLNKVAINVEGKTIHFDHLLFGDKYIYCIGVNYYPLAINGKQNDKKWFRYKANNKFVYIKNPMRLHRERVNYFSSLISSDSDLFVATIVINNSCLIDEKCNTKYDKVINLKNLENMVKNYEKNSNVEPIDPILLHQLVQDVYRNGIEKKS